jgi:hypothetical protein
VVPRAMRPYIYRLFMYLKGSEQNEKRTML